MTDYTTVVLPVAVRAVAEEVVRRLGGEVIYEIDKPKQVTLRVPGKAERVRCPKSDYKFTIEGVGEGVISGHCKGPLFVDNPYKIPLPTDRTYKVHGHLCGEFIIDDMHIWVDWASDDDRPIILSMSSDFGDASGTVVEESAVIPVSHPLKDSPDEK